LQANLVEVEHCQRAEDVKVCAYCAYEKREEAAKAHCLQCGDHVCGPCADAHRRTKLTRDHALVPLEDLAQGSHQEQLRAHQGVACSAHPRERVKFFCLRCEELICRECRVSAHEKHSCSDLQSATEGFRGKMTTMLDSIRDKLGAMQGHLRALEEYREQVESTGRQMTEVIEMQASALHEMVDKHKEQMLKALSTSAEQEEHTIEEKQRNTRKRLDTMEAVCDYVTFHFANAKAEEVLLARHLVGDRLVKVNRLTPDLLGSRLSMRFSKGNAATEQQLHSIFGKMEIFHIPVNGQRGKTPPAIIKEPLPPPPQELHSIGDSVRMLHSFECRGRGDQKDIWPTGVTTDQNGNIVVVDRENKAIKIFEWTGRMLQELGKRQLGCPYDATVLSNQHMAVSDHEDEDIKVFGLPGGDLLRTLKGVVKYPRGISHNSRDHLLIVDAHHRVIRVMEEDGRALMSIPAAGSETSESFSDPHYICISYDDSILLSDWTAPHVKVFSPEGQPVLPWMQEEMVLQPHGICIDTQGCVLVADNQRHRVLLFTSDGHFLRTLVSKEHGLWHPMALAISPLGYLVVTEALGRIKVFKYK
jgi:hypothetical protein